MKNYIHILKTVIGGNLHKLKTLIWYGNFQSREYIVDRERRLVYLVNSKVACSSIKACICGSQNDDDSVHTEIGRGGWLRKDVLQGEEKSYFKFTFVRDPFSRLVSCYESKYHHDKEFYKKKVFDFDHYLFGYIRKDQGFDTFVRKIVKLPACLLDKHFLVQYDLTHDRQGRKLVDFIGKSEHMSEDFGKVQKKCGLPDLPHFNRTDKKKKNWMDYYTKETARLVYRKYQKDIKAFGYEESYRKLMAYLDGREQA